MSYDPVYSCFCYFRCSIGFTDLPIVSYILLYIIRIIRSSIRYHWIPIRKMWTVAGVSGHCLWSGEGGGWNVFHRGALGWKGLTHRRQGAAGSPRGGFAKKYMDARGWQGPGDGARICQNMSEYARGMCKSQENVKDREGHIRPDMARTSCPSKMTSIGDKASEERFRSKTHNSKEATILRTNLQTISNLSVALSLSLSIPE